MEGLTSPGPGEMLTAGLTLSLTRGTSTCPCVCPALSLSLPGRPLKERTWSLPLWSLGQEFRHGQS